MKKEYRLKSSSEIQDLKKNGVSLASPYLILVFAENHTDQKKIAVIASRSVGGAINRNRCKRILRAAVDPVISQIQPGYNLLLVARRPILEAKFLDVSKATHSLLIKGRLLKDAEYCE